MEWLSRAKQETKRDKFSRPVKHLVTESVWQLRLTAPVYCAEEAA